jgi:hypothetical protein
MFCEPMYGVRGALLSGSRKNVKHIIATKDNNTDKNVKSSISVNIITIVSPSMSA